MFFKLDYSHSVTSNYNFKILFIRTCILTRYLRQRYITASEESPLHSTKMNNSKYTGETIAGVTMQMRFIPLKVDTEQDKKFSPWSTSNDLVTTIKTRIDDTKKSTPENIREFQIPTITRLTSEGETFIKNKIKLIDTIFTPKGWLEPADVTKRLDKYASFMTNIATTDFAICQRCARNEFIKRYGDVDEPLKFKIKSEQNEFLE